MQLPFVKYEGTGNDFILIDDRTGLMLQEPSFIRRLCDRHYGIGSDGVLLLRNHEGFDFEMVFFNPDGSEATFCGNGGRCMVAFAQSLEIIGIEASFIAADGVHKAAILGENSNKTVVELGMQDAEIYEYSEERCYLNTGTYHYVEYVPDAASADVEARGRLIRYQDHFAPHGTNVNFVSFQDGRLNVRTYEKGVEAETLSCGTGVTASAIAASLKYGGTEFDVHALGGNLKVRFNRQNDRFTQIRLIGPVTRVFEGQFGI